MLAEDTDGVPAAAKGPRALEEPVELGRAALVMEVRLELENRLSELDEPNTELKELIMLIELDVGLDVGMTELDVTRLLVELDLEEVELDEIKTELDSELGLVRTERDVEVLIVELDCEVKVDCRIGVEEDEVDFVEEDEEEIFEIDETFEELKVPINFEVLELLDVFAVDDEEVEIFTLELLVLVGVDEVKVEVFGVDVWILDVLELEALRLEVAETALPTG